MRENKVPLAARFEHASAVIEMTKSPGWHYLLEDLKGLKESTQKILEKASDTPDIYRAQGGMNVIRLIEELRKDLEQYLDRQLKGQTNGMV